MEGEALSGTAQFIIGQTVGLVVLLVGIYVALRVQLTKIETNQGHEVEQRRELRADHDNLDKRVQGISRTVERHDTILNMNQQG